MSQFWNSYGVPGAADEPVEEPLLPDEPLLPSELDRLPLLPELLSADPAAFATPPPTRASAAVAASTAERVVFFRMYFPHTDVDSARRFGRTQL